MAENLTDLANRLMPFVLAAIGGQSYDTATGGVAGAHDFLSPTMHNMPVLAPGVVLASPAATTGVPVFRAITLADITTAMAGRTITAGSGLTGSGNLGSDLTLNVGAGSGILVSADAVAVDTGATFVWTAAHTFNVSASFVAGASVAGASALSFGGDAALSRTAANTLTVAAGDVLQADVIRAVSSSAAIEIDDRSAGGSGARWVLWNNNTTLRWWSNSAGGDRLYLTATGVLQSPGYVSQTTGAAINYTNGGADFRYLFTDELHAKAFIADLEQALAGLQIITKSVALLDVAFTVPAAGAAGGLIVRDLPSATGMQVFVNGDFLRLRTFARAGGALSIGDCWGTVTLDTTFVRTLTVTATGGTFTLTSTTTTGTIAYNASTATVRAALEGLASIGAGNVEVTGAPGAYVIQFIGTLQNNSVALTVNTGGLTGGTASLAGSGYDSTRKRQRFTFTRSAGADAGAMAAGTVLQPDLVVLDYGTAGNGIYEVNAVDGTYGANAPYARVATWSTHPRTMTERVRLGRLTGITTGANEYGLYVGDGGITDTNKFMRLSNLVAQFVNIDFELYRGGVRRFRVDAATPYIALGSPNPTAYLGATGFYVGDNGSGVYRMHIGTASAGTLTEGMAWDGSALQIKTSAGNILVSGNGLQVAHQSGLLTRKESSISFGWLSGATRQWFQFSDASNLYIANTNGAPSFAVASYLQFDGAAPYYMSYAGGVMRADAAVFGYSGIWAYYNGSPLSVGVATVDYVPTSTKWSTGDPTNATVLLSGLNSTAIGFHDSGVRVDYIVASAGTITLGYDGGWGSASVHVPNHLRIRDGSTGSFLFHRGSTDATSNVVFRTDGNDAYIWPWGTGTTNNRVVIGGGTNVNFRVTGNLTVGTTNTWASFGDYVATGGIGQAGYVNVTINGTVRRLLIG